jgi:hypothetical protein
MTKQQFYGWSREDAAPLNEVTIPRNDSTWLARRLKELKQAQEASDERSESNG